MPALPRHLLDDTTSVVSDTVASGRPNTTELVETLLRLGGGPLDRSRAPRTSGEVDADLLDLADTLELTPEATGGPHLARLLRATVDGAPADLADLVPLPDASQAPQTAAEPPSSDVYDDDDYDDYDGPVERTLTLQLRADVSLVACADALFDAAAASLQLLGQVETGPPMFSADGTCVQRPVTVTGEGGPVDVGLLASRGVVTHHIASTPSGDPVEVSLLGEHPLEADEVASVEATVAELTGMLDDDADDADEVARVPNEAADSSFHLIITRADGQPLDVAQVATVVDTLQPNLTELGELATVATTPGHPASAQLQVVTAGRIPLRLLQSGLAAGAGRGVIDGVGAVTVAISTEAPQAG